MSAPKGWLVLLLVLVSVCSVGAAERDALAVSRNIRMLHMPFGTILDPVFPTSDGTQIVGYSRCGDSAIWTGHYLAAEAFRYNVTSAVDALDNVRAALGGLQSLVEVTGTDLLARCLVPVSSPHTAAITQEEAQHGIHPSTVNGVPFYWVGNTSRDQYCGVFFGLSVAFDMVDHADVRSELSALGTRLLDFLIRNGWNVRMPDGSISTSFLGRADQQLTLLQIGRRLNPGRFSTTYDFYRFFKAASVTIPIAAEVLDDHHSYFKFNLNTINFYNLIRLESSSFKRFYDEAYDLMRRTTDDHGNAHFNLVDRALRGAEGTRDAATRSYLRDWLLRPGRDPHVDLSGRYIACGPDRTCSAIPILDRVRTDFLWQRSPFLLFGGGVGTIEGAGIDYILPYWMGRFYGVIASDPQPPLALSVSPDSETGSGAVFQFEIWDPDGYEDVTVGLVVINRELSSNESCYLYFDRAGGLLWLATDAGDAWLGPAALGSSAQLQNSQCRIDAGRSSNFGVGETAMLNVSASFLSSAGRRNIYLYAKDAGGLETGWQRVGDWTVP
jgi:hypothetical protein